MVSPNSQYRVSPAPVQHAILQAPVPATAPFEPQRHRGAEEPLALAPLPHAQTFVPRLFLAREARRNRRRLSQSDVYVGPQMQGGAVPSSV